MSTTLQQFEQRKQDHIDIVLEKDTQTTPLSELDALCLTHEALPDLNFDEITLQTVRFGKTVSTPFFISSMTAGHKGAIDINATLMRAAENTNWWMGVGSQRRELSDPNAAKEWRVLKKTYPNVQLMGNLGIAQLCQSKLCDVQKLVDNLAAQAMIIHLNPLQECIQPEGTPQFRGGLKALEELARGLDVPVIVKETGCGFSPATLKRLNNLGIKAVDVSGLGGTHWGRVEGYRAQHSKHLASADSFKNWGISSVQSLINAQGLNLDYECWGSGGVRNGLDAAKLIALGASSIGLAKPLLQAALLGHEQVIDTMKTIEYELRVALFCTGSSSLRALLETHRDLIG